MATDESSEVSVSKAEFNRMLKAMEGIQDQMHSIKMELSDERDATICEAHKIGQRADFQEKEQRKQFNF